jgi:hypothetical protein
VKILIWFTGLCIAAAGIAWASPARAQVTGNGFTEYVMSCVADSEVTLHPQKGNVVLLRAAPECSPIDPFVFKARKDRLIVLKVARDGTGEVFVHEIRVEAKK